MQSKHLFLAIFTCLISFGCSHHSDDIRGEICQFYIHLVDKEGKDLSLDLKTRNGSEIERAEYNLKIYWNGELIKPEMEIYTAFTKGTDDPRYLFFSIHPIYFDRKENKIDFQLISPRIFEDEEKHVFSAIWNIEKQENEERHVFESLTYEGKNISPTFENYFPLYKIQVE